MSTTTTGPAGPAVGSRRNATTARVLGATADGDFVLARFSLGLHRLTATGAALLAPTITAFGVLAGAFQTLGWIRWPFAAPQLARTYLDPATPEDTRAAAAASYDLINSYAGGALGEHLGWLFQAGWGIGIALLIARTGLASRAPSATA